MKSDNDCLAVGGGPGLWRVAHPLRSLQRVGIPDCGLRWVFDFAALEAPRLPAAPSFAGFCEGWVPQA